jgi:hypothetical protein
LINGTVFWHLFMSWFSARVSVRSFSIQCKIRFEARPNFKEEWWALPSGQ